MHVTWYFHRVAHPGLHLGAASLSLAQGLTLEEQGEGRRAGPLGRNALQRARPDGLE